ncbi:MAG: hypothetical protein KJ619_00960 [Candidatus Omnitrophica bacterium]|nr:hypothetical protein [Candidatus Omnitrophota bacterium]
MKSLFLGLFLSAALLFSGYVFPAEKKCCLETACQCQGLECCKDGQCSCKGACCKDNNCLCQKQDEAKACGCRKK